MLELGILLLLRIGYSRFSGVLVSSGVSGSYLLYVRIRYKGVNSLGFLDALFQTRPSRVIQI